MPRKKEIKRKIKKVTKNTKKKAITGVKKIKKNTIKPRVPKLLIIR